MSTITLAAEYESARAVANERWERVKIDLRDEEAMDAYIKSLQECQRLKCLLVEAVS